MCLFSTNSVLSSVQDTKRNATGLQEGQDFTQNEEIPCPIATYMAQITEDLESPHHYGKHNHCHESEK